MLGLTYASRAEQRLAKADYRGWDDYLQARKCLQHVLDVDSENKIAQAGIVAVDNSETLARKGLLQAANRLNGQSPGR